MTTFNAQPVYSIIEEVPWKVLLRRSLLKTERKYEVWKPEQVSLLYCLHFSFFACGFPLFTSWHLWHNTEPSGWYNGAHRLCFPCHCLPLSYLFYLVSSWWNANAIAAHSKILEIFLMGYGTQGICYRYIIELFALFTIRFYLEYLKLQITLMLLIYMNRNWLDNSWGMRDRRQIDFFPLGFLQEV